MSILMVKHYLEWKGYSGPFLQQASLYYLRKLRSHILHSTVGCEEQGCP
jgi:hypothetical protein